MRGKISRFTPSIRQEMANMYLAGSTSQQVAIAFGTDKSTICDMLHSIAIVRRTESETKRKYRIRENAFEKVQDEETSYWLGFLYADGCVYGRRNGGDKGLNVILQDREGVMTDHVKSHVHYLIYRGTYKANIVGKWLYREATIYLSRKYDKIQNFSLPKRKRANVGTVGDMTEATVKKYIELGQG